MEFIKKLNLNHCRAHIQRSGESAAITFMGLTHDHLQDYLKLLKKRELKLVYTAGLDNNSRNISKVSALKVLKGCAHFMYKKNKNFHYLKPQATRETDNFRESKTIETNSQKEEGFSMEVISASKLKKILEAENSLLILDVREENELLGRLGHCDNSVNILVENLRERVLELETMRYREIRTVCRSGVRAARATKVLEREGFENVKVLAGGMLAWRKIYA